MYSIAKFLTEWNINKNLPKVKSVLGVVPKIGEAVGRGITGMVFGDVEKEGIKGIPKHIWETEKELLKIPAKFSASALQAFKAPGGVEKKPFKLPVLGEIPTYQYEAKQIFNDVIEGKRPLYEALAPFIQVPIDGSIMSSLLSSGARSVISKIKVNEPQVAAAIKKMGLTDLSPQAQKAQFWKLSKEIPETSPLRAELNNANDILNTARQQRTLLKNPTKLVQSFRNLAETGLKDVKDVMRTGEGTAYLGIKGLLPEQAGTIPIQPYQEYRKLNFGLSTREINSKRAGVEIIKKNLPAQLEYISKDAGKAIAKLDFSKLNTIDEAVSLIKKTIPKTLMTPKVFNAITNWEKTAKMFEAETEFKKLTHKNLIPIKKSDPLIQTAEEFMNKSGIVPEWGTKNQYYLDNPYKPKLDAMKKTGKYDMEVLKDAERWEMGQTLKDKPSFLSNNLSKKEVSKFAKDNNLWFRSKGDKIVVAKDIESLNKTLNAIDSGNQRELGLSLGYIDIWKKANNKTANLIQEAKKYKTAEEFVNGQIKTTNGVKHLDPKDYTDFDGFSRDIEKLNEANTQKFYIGDKPPLFTGKETLTPYDIIDVTKKLWKDKPAYSSREIPIAEIKLVERPLAIKPKAGRKIESNILVYAQDGKFNLLDGRHRLDQAIANGQKTIKADISGESMLSQLTDIWKKANKSVKKSLLPIKKIDPLKAEAETKETGLTPQDEYAIMQEAFELQEGKAEIKNQIFYDPEMGSEREAGYQNFKKFLNRSKRRIDIEDYGQLVEVSKKSGINTDYEFFSGAGGDISNDELLDVFKERYIQEKGGLDVLISEVKQTPIQRATERIKTLKPKLTGDKAQKMAEEIVAKFMPPREEAGFLYHLEKVYRKNLDAKYLQKFGDEGKTIYNKIREGETWAIKEKSEKVLNLSKALKGLSKNELENFGNYVEGFVSTPKNVIKSVNEWKKISKDISEKAQQFGMEIKLPNGNKIPFKPKDDYYPYFLKEDALKKILKDRKGYIKFLVEIAKKNNITVAKADRIIHDMTSNRANFYGHLERPREAILPLDFYERDPKKILAQYISESYDRLGDAMVFKGNDKILQDLIEKIRIEGGDYQEVQKLVDRALQRERFGETERILSLYARTFNNLTKLSLVSITNLGDIYKSFARTGVIPALKALPVSLKDTPLTQKAGVLDLEIMKYAEEQGVALTKAGQKFFEITGFKATEKFVRRLAVNSAKNYVDILFNKLKKNPSNVFARRRLEQFNLNPDELLERGLKESDYVDAGIKAIQDMQPISRVDLPYTWQSPKGKLITQYKTFAYKQAAFMSEFIFKEAKKGNVEPLIITLIVGTALGEGVADLKALARGKKRTKDVSRRIIDNLMTIGGIGLASDFLASLQYGGAYGGAFLRFVAGPTISDIDAWGTAIYSDIQTIASDKKQFAKIGELSKKGEVKPKTLKKIIYSVPFIGPYLANTLFPTNIPYTTKTIPIAEEIINAFQREEEAETVKLKPLKPLKPLKLKKLKQK